MLSSRNFNDLLNEEMKNNDTNVSGFGVMPNKLGNKLPNRHKSLVTIVLIEAKRLPPVPEDGETHKLYCKFRLGPVSYKTKSVASTVQPKWRERFNLRLHKDDFLKISVWDKGKQKNFMGSCILDLSCLENERTHDIWQQLDDGCGLIHLAISTSLSSFSNTSLIPNLLHFEEAKRPQYIRSSWQIVGSLQVNIVGARSLVRKADTYCTLELDNERVQTPKVRSSSEPTWDKCYVFCVYDVTSTLDLKVYGRSITSALLYKSIGKVSIPLLMIVNGEQRWYALKDRSEKYVAKGNCPSICLQMTLIWNPIKASLRIFRPKPVKYVKKSKKYDPAKIYSNVDFIGKSLNFLYKVNEDFKRLFEWDDPESSLVALSCWLVFCYYFRLWTVPLFLLVPFSYYWLSYSSRDNKYHTLSSKSDTSKGANKSNSEKNKNLAGTVQDVQHTTLVVINGLEFMASLAERLYNLVSFKVPFLSYLAMAILVIASLLLYFVPYNYLMMALGIYKYARKYFNPDRVLNNDLLDFLSRIPDNTKLKEWRQLSVPEPVQNQSSGILARSVSTEILT